MRFFVELVLLLPARRAVPHSRPGALRLIAIRKNFPIKGKHRSVFRVVGSIEMACFI